jgi:RNA polymerase sigma-70 factor (ECF subfamily)
MLVGKNAVRPPRAGAAEKDRPMHTTSASLLERLRRPGDNESWSRLVKLYTPLLYYWLRREGLQQDDAADVVQDVFVVLMQKLPEFSYNRQKGQFRAWLRTVTLNKLRDRRKRRRPVLVGKDEKELEERAGPDTADLFADEEYQRHVVARALELMQGEFAATTWKACWEHVAVGRPAPEVAAELGLSPGAVYAARFRVLGRLRQELAGLDVE